MSGIWIRSQDGRVLIFAVAVYFEDKLPAKIKADTSGDGAFFVGTYPTEARAVEVLDEIELFRKGEYVNRKHRNKWDTEDVCYCADPATDTYKMPKE